MQRGELRGCEGSTDQLGDCVGANGIDDVQGGLQDEHNQQEGRHRGGGRGGAPVVSGWIAVRWGERRCVMLNFRAWCCWSVRCLSTLPIWNCEI